MTLVEIACFNEASARIAAEAGVGRIELCRDLSEGGCTPDALLLRDLKVDFPSMSIFAMIRIRGGDFCYSDQDIKRMKEEMCALLEAGADGFVFGCLTAEGEVHKEHNKQLTQQAGGRPCTFHRAFDRIDNKMRALDDLIELGFKRILTSGGPGKALDHMIELTILRKRATGRIIILPGGGIRSEHARSLIQQTGVEEIHSSALINGATIADKNEIMALLQC